MEHKMEHYKNLVGWLCGKEVHVHTKSLMLPESVISDFIKQFNMLETMREICTLSNVLFLPNGIVSYFGIPYNDNTLCDAIILTAKYASIDGKKKPNEKGIQLILQIALGVEEARIRDDLSPREMVMKIAYEQFRLQERPMNSIGRMWCIFTKIWPTLGSKIDPIKDIETEIGVSYQSIIYFGMAMAGSDQGYVLEYDENTLKEVANEFMQPLEKDSHKKFLDWISCDRSKFISNAVPPVYIRHPVLNSGLKRPQGDLDVYFAPSPNNIIARISTGIYYDLIDKYNLGGGDNEFKVDFGNAFEKYVGLLLTEYLTSYSISGEIKYGSKKQQCSSVDFFVRKDNTVLLIEVKQSSIFADAKFSGDSKKIAKSFTGNVLKAVKQLSTTEKDIIGKKYKALSNYENCVTILKLVVVADPIYNANSVAKSILELEHNVDAHDIGFINISDLEELLDLQDFEQSLFALLNEKQSKEMNMDFKEFILSKFPDVIREMRFIKKNYNEVMGGFIKTAG
jgi:hypothetical protein